MQYPYITVSLTHKTLMLFRSAADYHSFPIAIGKPDTPTPKGTWHIVNKKIIPDEGAFGSHWLGLNVVGYGIHGTNQPDLIGTQVSGGCIRMHNSQIQFVFTHVSIGVPVIITD